MYLRALHTQFLSTPSGWRATTARWWSYVTTNKISIHALRVEGDHLDKEQYMRQTISIHALRVEGDHMRTKGKCPGLRISIHALRVEGDFLTPRGLYPQNNFYPRPPGGGRPACISASCRARLKFLSTPSGWRATSAADLPVEAFDISIHALRVEGDLPSG